MTKGVRGLLQGSCFVGLQRHQQPGIKGKQSRQHVWTDAWCVYSWHTWPAGNGHLCSPICCLHPRQHSCHKLPDQHEELVNPVVVHCEPFTPQSGQQTCPVQLSHAGLHLGQQAGEALC